MSLTVTPTPDIQLANGDALTISKLNRLAQTTFSVSGTLSSSEIAAGAVTDAKTKAGVHFFAATCTLAAGVYTLTWPTDQGPASLAAGLVITFKTDAANVSSDALSGAVDLNAGVGGAKDLLKADGTQLGKGELAAGSVVIVMYDGTQFRLVSVSRTDILLPPNLVVNLKAYCDDATYDDFDLSADAVVVEDPNGARHVVRNLSVNVDAGNTGANGRDAGSFAAAAWWYIWVISTGPGGTDAGLVSTSDSAPTMPSGYTYKARVGCIRSTGGAWRPFYQTDQMVWIAPADIWSSAQTAPAGYAVLDATASGLSNFQAAVAPIAKSALGYIGTTNAQPCAVRLSACLAGGSAGGATAAVGECDIQMADSTLAFSSSTRTGAQFEVPMMVTAPANRNLQWKGLGSGTYQMTITGYRI